MNAILIAAETLPPANRWAFLALPLTWALATGAVGLWLLVPGGWTSVASRRLGYLLTVVSGFLLAVSLPHSHNLPQQITLALLAVLTLGSAVAMLATRNPVYSALWFALSLIGASSLFMVQGAQFLGVATIVVYAGAIVVTFLFVIMLAQPEGHAAYDRLSWGFVPRPLAIGASILLLALILGTIPRGSSKAMKSATKEMPNTKQMAMPITGPHHMAHLGRELFSQQLVAVEIGGALLMAALVGAVAIAIHGKNPRREDESSTGEMLG